MPDTATLTALLHRVRAATGPDRGLDADLCVALGYLPGPRVTVEVIAFDSKGGWNGYDKDGKHVAWSAEIPALTGSIDAAAALVERMLPGAPRTVGFDGPELDQFGWASVWNGTQSFTETAATEPLAILKALLKALGAEDDHELLRL